MHNTSYLLELFSVLEDIDISPRSNDKKVVVNVLEGSDRPISILSVVDLDQSVVFTINQVKLMNG